MTTVDLSIYGTTAPRPPRATYALAPARCAFCGEPLEAWRVESPGLLPSCGKCKAAKGGLSLEGYRSKLAHQIGVSAGRVRFWFEGEEE